LPIMHRIFLLKSPMGLSRRMILFYFSPERVGIEIRRAQT
jgi:hypothetical protein